MESDATAGIGCGAISTSRKCSGLLHPVEGRFSPLSLSFSGTLRMEHPYRVLAWQVSSDKNSSSDHRDSSNGVGD
eukprot:1369567-Amphidinium_carterae.1